MRGIINTLLSSMLKIQTVLLIERKYSVLNKDIFMPFILIRIYQDFQEPRPFRHDTKGKCPVIVNKTKTKCSYAICSWYDRSQADNLLRLSRQNIALIS